MPTPTTLNLTLEEANELLFLLANLNSPSREEALKLVMPWRKKLTVAVRKMRPSTPDLSYNVN